MPSFLEVSRLMHQVMRGEMSRREFVRRTAALGFTASAIGAFLAACGGSSSTPAATSAATTAAAGTTAATTAPAATSAAAGAGTATAKAGTGAATPQAAATQAPQGQGKRGGTLKVALNSDLASADIMFGTPNINRDVMGHVYEYLFTMSEKNEYIPMLAEKDMTVSSDGKEFTIPLRTGVKFHNGQPFTSADAVASLQRWQRMTSRGKTIMANLTDLSAPDDHTVKLTFSQPNGGLLFGIGQYGGLAAMLPKAIIDKYYDATKKADAEIKDADAIGTGPYQLKEWVRDNVIKMVRYDGYAARSEPSDGRGGKAWAYVDEIDFIPVADTNTRLNGLIAGEYHLSYTQSPAQYQQIKGDPNLQAYIIKPGSKAVAVFNKKQGAFTDQKLRQAALAATDVKEVMAGTIDDPDFYLITPSLAGPEWAFWYTEVGKDQYLTRDVNKAKQLVAQTSYKGEKLRFITTKDYDYMYRSALVVSKQWAEAGINVELIVSDWPTVVTNRSKPDVYEIFSTGIGFEGDPLGTSAYGPDWPGWTTSPGVTGAQAKLVTETDPGKRQKLWQDLQQAFYDEVPYIQFGEMYTLRAARKEVMNYNTRQDLMLWNVWLSK